MRTHRKFLCSGALFALLAAACGGQPESAATSQPAAEPAPAAAPAAEQTAQADGDAAPAERPRLVAPVRGEALIGHTRPNTVRRGDNYVTTIRIQNLSDGAVAGFRAEEFWYDANNQPVSGSNTFRARQPLQPARSA